jgi:hypothetical protein
MARSAMEHAANYKETVENMGRYMTDNDLTPLGTWVAVPNDYFSSQFVANFFGIWAAAFAFLALPFVLYMWIKKKDNIPILVWLGGWVCSLLEPMLDHLGHLWWSHNLAGPAMSGFHLNIPFLIPPCYCGFVAMTGYLTYLVMRNGATKKKIWLVWLLFASTDLLLEIPGCYLYAYMYYGFHPFRVFNFPMFWVWVNGAGFHMVGFLLYLTVPHLKGLGKAWLLLVVVTAFGLNYGIIGWPYFMALNWVGITKPMVYFLSLVSLSLALITVWWVAEFAGIDSKRRLILSTEKA